MAVGFKANPTEFMFAFFTVHVIATLRFFDGSFAARTFSKLQYYLLDFECLESLINRIFQSFITVSALMGSLQANFTV